MTGLYQRDWWTEVHKAFMSILYRHDPLGMGSTIGAPDDEYFDEASRTMRALLDASEGSEPAVAISAVWPGSDKEMLDELAKAWRQPPGRAGAEN